MRRLIHSAAAISAALLTLMMLAGAVRSGMSIDRAEPGRIRSTAEYSLTRIVTITAYPSTTPAVPGLTSRRQIDMVSQQPLKGTFGLPPDASAITVSLVNGEYSIDYARRAIVVTDSQGVYFEYRTDQEARRFGNQILISQTYKFNRYFHYVGTVIFTDPYRYVGYSGYAPTQVNTTRLHWDESLAPDTRFDAQAWLVDPAESRPDLEIGAATLDRRLNHIYVTATIHNRGGITAGAPSFVNVYDRLATSGPPTGPLDLAGGWCALNPVTRCGGSAGNRLPAVPPDETVDFAADFDLSPTNGQHDIYLFVDALGAAGVLGQSDGVGLNYESAEGNNLAWVGTLIWYKSFVFLPLVRRG